MALRWNETKNVYSFAHPDGKRPSKGPLFGGARLTIEPGSDFPIGVKHRHIGIRMNRQPNGTTLVAVDIDVKNGSTFNALTQNRCWSTATAIAITPSGGIRFLLLSMARSTCGSNIRHRGLFLLRPGLLVDLRRGGCVAETGPRSGRRARTARNTSTWPQTARQPLSGPGDPSGPLQPPRSACWQRRRPGFRSSDPVSATTN
jgi:hypothetical protein